MEVSTNLGRVSLVPRGAYDPSEVYRWLDVVQYDGSSYLVLKNGIAGIAPIDGTDYMLLALKGDQGDTGPQGVRGLKGERGDKGDQGDQGDRGDPGSSIASIERTDGSGAAGTVDTYTVTLTDGSTTTFQVRNGADGDGAGDMTKSTYDPQGKAQDIFRYVDEAVKTEAISLDEIDAMMGVAAQQGGTDNV